MFYMLSFNINKWYTDMFARENVLFTMKNETNTNNKKRKCLWVCHFGHLNICASIILNIYVSIHQLWMETQEVSKNVREALCSFSAVNQSKIIFWNKYK